MSVYVAKCQKCGRIIAAAVDCTHAADDVADMVRQGYVVERVEGPVSLGGLCEHVQEQA